MRNGLKRAVSRTVWTLLGRRTMLRIGNFLNNEARLDVPNDPATSGELAVQTALIQASPRGRKLCVFDVGANVGHWSRSFLERCVSHGVEAQIRAFEPNEGTYENLVRNLADWQLEGRVEANRIALSARDEARTFYSSGVNSGVSGFYRSGDTIAAMTVRATTLDRYCSDHGIERIDFLKIDTEGHDLEVLHGAKAMLEGRRISAIQFEYNQKWMLSRHFLHEVFSYLSPLGLAIGKITPRGVEFYPRWDREIETFREANFLAVEPALRPSFRSIDWWMPIR
jgi:FkbM family methyltransferase